MSAQRLQPHYKGAKAGRQIFLPPGPPCVVPLPFPVRPPSPPPVNTARMPLTAKTGMARPELEERFALAASIKARLDALLPVSTVEPDTVNKILARQNTIVENMNALKG